jgi:hypothetical protein
LRSFDLPIHYLAQVPQLRVQALRVQALRVQALRVQGSLTF